MIVVNRESDWLCLCYISTVVFCLGCLTVIDEGRYNGLSCQLSFECTKCGRKTSLSTSKKNKNAHEINVRASLAMAELGLGREGMATISTVMGMPLPSTQNAWDKTNKSLSNALDVVLEKQYENAAMKVRELMVEDGGAISDQSVVDIVVSCDGTWHHRGLRASHGIGIVVCRHRRNP